MIYNIQQQDAAILIRIADATGQGKQLLEAMRNCQRSIQHGCTVECGKMVAMDESGEGSEVILRVIPRPGERVEIDAVRRCLHVLWQSCSQSMSRH